MQTWQEYFEYEGDYLPQHTDYFTPTRLDIEIDFLLKEVIRSKQETILDLACGQGRHTIELTKLGYTVTGLDRSEQLLNLAYGAAAESNISATFVKQDIRNLDLEKQFDVILFLFCTFGIENDEENKKILRRLSKHLSPNGRIFFEVHNLFRFSRRMKESNVTYAKLDLRTLQLWDKTAEGLELPLRLYTIPELSDRLKSVGLSVKQVWGGYKESDWDYNLDSDRILILAEKS